MKKTTSAKPQSASFVAKTLDFSPLVAEISAAHELPVERDDVLRRRLFELARDRFRRFGTRRVTMDELARELRISKKTIYRLYDGKEALVLAYVNEVATRIFSHISESFASNKGSGIEQLLDLQQALTELSHEVSTEFLADLKIEFPAIWEAIESRRQFALGRLECFYREGIANGKINPRIHPKVAVAIHYAFMRNVIHPDAFIKGEFSLQEAIETIMTIMSHGIAAPDEKPTSAPRKRAGRK